MNLKVVNPANGEIINAFETMAMDKTQQRIHAAENAFQAWKATSIAERTELIHELARLLEMDKVESARLMGQEMGKPIREGILEVEKCAWVCRYYAEHATEMLGPEPIQTDARNSYVVLKPLGVILGVMPWNYPFWQVFRFAVPTLLCGNTVLLKHASNVPGCATKIENLFKTAGFPSTVFQDLRIASGEVGQIIKNPTIKGVALTGSKTAGQAVAARAGKLIKPSVLELGGSDPYLIFKDADLELAARACAKSRLLNSGQSCIAAKRFIVVHEIRDEFEEHLVSEMGSAKLGDPLDAETEIGPLARQDLRDTLHVQVRRSVDLGARVLLGAAMPTGKGFFYPPTVMSDVRPGMPTFDEETFGPVAAIVPAANELDMVKLANQTDFGLGAAVFTRDLKRGEQIAADQLAAGNCFVNTFVKSDPRLPFGGIKASGYGRELSHYGIRSFVNVKTVYIA
jgi:succinate-semialdehyde dehydrogenase/glutarate-semialdehyde dehydrogenase